MRMDRFGAKKVIRDQILMIDHCLDNGEGLSVA